MIKKYKLSYWSYLYKTSIIGKNKLFNSFKGNKIFRRGLFWKKKAHLFVYILLRRLDQSFVELDEEICVLSRKERTKSARGSGSLNLGTEKVPFLSHEEESLSASQESSFNSV